MVLGDTKSGVWTDAASLLSWGLLALIERVARVAWAEASFARVLEFSLSGGARAASLLAATTCRMTFVHV
mgnify:CR=1 FL=1